MRDALPEHFAVVGPAWLDFERAVRAAGAVGEDLNEQLDSLRSRIPPATLDVAHQLRRQRNALFHDGTLVRDLRGWETRCRNVIAELGTPAGFRTRGTRSNAARSSRNRVAPVAVVLLVLACAGLVVGFAWFDAAPLCGGSSDRLRCTFDAASYVTPALAGLAVAGIALGLLAHRLGRR